MACMCSSVLELEVELPSLKYNAPHPHSYVHMESMDFVWIEY